MLTRLNQNQYAIVRPIYEMLSYNLVIASVIDGNTPGWVYVDDPDHPNTALIWNRQDALLLAGSAADTSVNAALRDLIATQIVPDAAGRGIPELSLHYSPEAWEEQLEDSLADLRLEKITRRFYRFGELPANWRECMPPGWKLIRIDEDLLDAPEVTNSWHVTGWVRSFWHTDRDFLENGFGYSLMKASEIASWCLTVYTSGNNYELGLATMPEYRRKGFATLTALACVAHCLENGYTPHWHCEEANIGSVKAAERAGFIQPTTYSIYQFDISD